MIRRLWFILKHRRCWLHRPAGDPILRCVNPDCPRKGEGLNIDKKYQKDS